MTQKIFQEAVILTRFQRFLILLKIFCTIFERFLLKTVVVLGYRGHLHPYLNLLNHIGNGSISCVIRQGLWTLRQAAVACSCNDVIEH